MDLVLVDFLFIMIRYLSKGFSTVGVSVAGGFTHIIVQLAVIAIFYLEGNKNVIILYGIGLTIMSVITSFLIGLIVLNANPRLLKIMKTLG